MSAAAVDVVALALGAIAVALAARRWGPHVFAEYTVTYEALGLVQPGLLIGMTVALPRAIARRGVAKQAGLAEDLLLGAAAPVLVLVSVVTLGVYVGRDFWDSVLYGSSGHSRTLSSLCALLASSCWCGLVTGYCRGRFRMGRANGLGLLYVGGAPLIALALSHSVAGVLGLTAVSWAVAATAMATPWRWRPSGVAAIADASRELLRYGARRVPGEFALFGLFSLPAILVVHQFGLTRAGYVALAISVLTAVASVFAVASQVSLPHASALPADDATDELRRHVRKMLPIVVVLAATACIVVEAAAPIGVRLYLGKDFTAAVPVVRVVTLATVPFAVFLCLRSTLDARHDRAVSLRNAIVALAVFLLIQPVTALTHMGYYIEATFVGAVWLLAALTARAIYQALWSDPKYSA